MQTGSWLAFLSRRTNNYLFHDQTTRQALEKIFGDYAGNKFEFRVPSGKTHTFRAQWCETDHNYVVSPAKFTPRR